MERIVKLFEVVYQRGLNSADLYTLVNLEKIQKEHGERFCVSIPCDKLAREGWLDNDNNYTEKSKELFKELGLMFKPLKEKKKKVEIQVDIEMVRKYNMIFPKKKLESGSQARSNEKEVIGKFKRFFEHQ
jgi:hypothetical protein